MASVVGSAVSVAPRPQSVAARAQASKLSGLRSLAFSFQGRNLRSLRMQPAPLRFHVSCAAKKETVEKVCEIVKKQLALPDETSVSGESKFASLGADSLDTVEIVMGIEEAFGVSVEEDSAQSIATVQDAADMIEKLLDAKN